MKKLDRLGWAEGLAFSAFGVRVGVRVNVPGVLARVLPLLPPGWKKSRRLVVQRLYSLMVAEGGERAGMRRLHVLYADSGRVARAAALDQVLGAFEADLHLHIAEASSDMSFLHAGVVGWQGRVIVVPGRSFSGKTTLVREMLRLGATYYSDEFAVVDNFGLVHPFTRPLGIREQGSEGQTKYTAERLGAISGVEPLPVGMAVISEYQRGAQWRPVPLSQGQGALELLANSVAREAAESILSFCSERGRLEVA
jgi:hypothetical protein